VILGDVEDPHLRCSSYNVDEDGKCKEGYLSLKKGSECSVDADCISSKQEPAVCSCTMDGTQNKFCSVGPDDDEWIRTRQLFNKYLAETVYCHPARRLEDCGHVKTYKEW